MKHGDFVRVRAAARGRSSVIDSFYDATIGANVRTIGRVLRVFDDGDALVEWSPEAGDGPPLGTTRAAGGLLEPVR